MDRKSCSSNSLYPVHVKDEVESVSNEQEHVKEVVVKVEHIKEEVEWEEWEDSTSYGVSETPSDLYAGHEVKDELVLGPEGLQPPDVAFTLYAAQASAVKKQPKLRDCVVMLERIDYLEALLANTRRGTAGRWTAGWGTEDLGTEDRGTEGRGTDGRGTAGRGTAGRGTAGRGTEGLGTERQGTERLGTERRGTERRGTKDRGTEGRGTEGRTAKSSRKKADLGNEIHRNINTVKKTYVCPICKLRFNLMAQLMEHVMIHIHQSTDQESCVADDEEEIDVVSLGPPLPLAPSPRGSAPPARHSQRAQRTRHKRLRTTAAENAHEFSTVTAQSYSLRARRPRRSNTDSESEAREGQLRIHNHLSEPRRPSIHNHLERLRRSELKKLFDALRDQIPAIKNKERAPKILILREAATLCWRLQEEQECLSKQRRGLIFKFRKLRQMAAARVRRVIL